MENFLKIIHEALFSTKHIFAGKCITTQSSMEIDEWHMNVDFTSCKTDKTNMKNDRDSVLKGYKKAFDDKLQLTER